MGPRHGGVPGRDVHAVVRADLDETQALPPVDEVIVERGLYRELEDIAPGSREQGRLLFADRAATARDGCRPNPFDPVLPRRARIFKRSIDLALLFLALPVLVLIVPLIAIVVKLSSRGPVFFKQQRVGVDGRLFNLYKFRTMFVDNDDTIHRNYVAALMRDEAPSHGGIYKLVDDPRVTKVGRFLRRYSLDEIPQVWNVVRGDMSLVGPRPPLPAESKRYDLDAWNRLRVAPGLTGLWQVSGRCELTFRQMVDLDVRYWREWSPLLDARIIARTPAALVSTRGAA